MKNVSVLINGDMGSCYVGSGSNPMYQQTRHRGPFVRTKGSSKKRRIAQQKGHRLSKDKKFWDL